MAKNMNQPEFYSKARLALREGRATDLLELSRQLLESKHDDVIIPGYMFRGNAYEIGGQGLEIDLDTSLDAYRHVAVLQSSSIIYIYMARVCMKQGGVNHEQAIKYLKEAEKIGNPPELYLAYGFFYENSQSKDYDLARYYYLQAAKKGRFHGFFGFSRVSRLLGQHGRAFAMDLARIVTGPLVFLILGRSASKDF